MKKTKQIFNQIFANKAQMILLSICIILSISTFICADSLKNNSINYIKTDSKIINGADIIIQTNKPYSKELNDVIQELRNNKDIVIANSYSFSSMSYSPKKNNSILSQVRIVTDTYPLYGNVKLLKGEELNLKNNNIVVEQELLDKLDLEIGDEIKIGNKIFTISNILINEPDRPLTLFDIGPRILIDEIYIEEINLVGERSRVDYKTLIKTNDKNDADLLVLKINSQLSDEKEKAILYSENNNTLKIFVDNFLFFIKLITIFIIILTGITISSIILTYLNNQKQTIGIRKTLGEENTSIIKFYYISILIVTTISIILSIIIAFFIMKSFPYIFSGILPQEISFTIDINSILIGIFLGLVITTLFALYPLLTIKKIKPLDIFRKEESINKLLYDKYFYIINTIIFLFFSTLVFIEIENVKTSLYLIIGFLSLFVIILFLNIIILKTIKKIKIKNLELKHAIKGLFRIGNKTLLVLTTISLSITIIFTISFIEFNLQEQYFKSFPANSPNLFIIDIPKENQSQIQNIIGTDNITFYPVIRGSLLSINDVSTKDIEEKRKRQGDSLTRTFSLTYTDKLLENEKIIASLEPNQMFKSNLNNDIIQVSVLDMVAESFNGKLGDELIFLIQGVEIKSQIVSIRKRTDNSINAFFYFTFEEKILKDAPQTIFSALNVENEKIPAIQNKIAKDFPTITVINAQSTAKSVAEIINKLSTVVSFFTIFSLITGIMILISSIIATNKERIKETVLYKLVGCNRNFILKIFTYEYLLIGIISSIIAITFSYITTFIIIKYTLNSDFTTFSLKLMIYSFITIISILTIGLISSINIIKEKPIEYIVKNQIE